MDELGTFSATIEGPEGKRGIITSSPQRLKMFVIRVKKRLAKITLYINGKQVYTSATKHSEDSKA